MFAKLTSAIEYKKIEGATINWHGNLVLKYTYKEQFLTINNFYNQPLLGSSICNKFSKLGGYIKYKNTQQNQTISLNFHKNGFDFACTCVLVSKIKMKENVARLLMIYFFFLYIDAS